MREQSAATKRMAKLRQKASAGGRRVPVSLNPNCKRPCPGPRAKRSSRRSATASSRGASDSPGCRRKTPCGVSTDVSDRGISSAKFLPISSLCLTRSAKALRRQSAQGPRLSARNRDDIGHSRRAWCEFHPSSASPSSMASTKSGSFSRKMPIAPSRSMSD